MIELRQITKRYGEIEALRGVSATISAGEVVGLLGPNGAGKTTAMKILVGYLLPTSGTAIVAGLDVAADPLAVQARIGYLPENAPLYSDMLVHEYLSFMAAMRGLDRGAAGQRIRTVAAECSIDDVLGRTIGQLSKGYRQRVGLAAAILHDPEILILDEPTTGLDPNQIVEVRDLIRKMGQSKTVILSTHILPEVQATCGRVLILYDGQLRADGRITDLTRSRSIFIRAATGGAAAARQLLERLPGVTGTTQGDDDDKFQTFRLALGPNGDADATAEAVFDAARARGWTLRELRRDEKTLEQVFREVTEIAEMTQ